MPESKLRWRDARHLILLGLVFLGGVIAFLVIRELLVPKGFGAQGHFRAGAIDDIRMRPVAFAGQGACADCHDSVVTTRNSGKHKGLACEGCHGPQARHAADPTAVKPERPRAPALCVRCHERQAGRPKDFPQVVSAEHSGGQVCTACHQPHNPKP